jgi:hypothetical protein
MAELRTNAMNRLTKSLLALAVSGIVVGVVSAISPGIPVGWNVALPLGAVFLGLFLIARMLQSEMEQFDAEEQARLKLVPQPVPSAVATRKSSQTELRQASAHAR